MTQAAMQDTSEETPVERLGQICVKEMIQVNAIILKRLESEVPMIPELAQYLIAAGGKRIRPLLTLACAYLCNDNTDNPKKLAAAVEFIHTATLLHDDVIDGSKQRRGKTTANSVFGNQATVLVGDFLFARAFELMVETGSIDALNSLARASSIITEGEVLQLSMIGETDLSQNKYFKIIEAKTAALFATACETPALLSNIDSTAFKTYGYNLGMAFQIVDDIMDYTSPKMGKDKGDDFREGKITLPVIIALEQATPCDRQEIISFLGNPVPQYMDRLLALLHKYNVFEQSLTIAADYSERAGTVLRPYSGEVADCLIDLPQSILNRVS